MGTWAYVLACIAVPWLVGGVMYVVVEVWDRRRRRTRPEDPLPHIDYLI